MQENDDLVNEKSQMSMMCKNFQLGTTRIKMAIKENNAMIFTIGTVAGASDNAIFDFRGNTKN